MKLLTPVKIGAFNLKNRVVYAPLTRCRAVGEGRIPNDLMAEYYTQRASAGLILSEATSIVPSGVGYPNTPGIWSEEQIEGWKKTTQSVHDAGGVILSQLWHVGRISHPIYQNGTQPISASAIAPDGHVSLSRPKLPFEVPRALETDEVKQLVKDFRKAAENAKRAGFDGVELHGANGYLPDQFLQDSTNKRTDEYGSSIENRARFMLEIVDELIDVWGADHVGVHLAPRMDAHSMGDSDPLTTFTYVAGELGKRQIAFIMTREYLAPDRLSLKIKEAFGGCFIANEGFNVESAENEIKEGHADAVGFGKIFLANPDLPERIAKKSELNPFKVETFYTPGPEGYTDYPKL